MLRLLYNKTVKGSKEKDLASRIIKEGDCIANIVYNFLSFARPEYKKEKDTISVNEILTDTLSLTAAQLKSDGIKLKLDTPQNLPDIVAHRQEIQQVFLNVISNARYALTEKYPGTDDNKILEILGEEIVVDHYPYIKITFYDHGTGIPANIKEKVMAPFFTTKPPGMGTGLGLSISYKIISDHGGKLLIDSVEGEFTKVAVILPAKSRSAS